MFAAALVAVLALAPASQAAAKLSGVVAAKASVNSVVIVLKSGALARVKCPRAVIAVGKKVIATGAYNSFGVFVATSIKTTGRATTTTIRAVTIGSDGKFDLVGMKGAVLRIRVPAHRPPGRKMTAKVRLGATLIATSDTAGALSPTFRLSGVVAATGSGVLALRMPGGSVIAIDTNHIGVSWLSAGDAAVMDVTPTATKAGVVFKLRQWARLEGALRFTAAKKLEYSGAVTSIGGGTIVVAPLFGAATTLSLPAGVPTGNAKQNDTVLVDAHMSGATKVADHVIVLTVFVPTTPPSASFVGTPPAATPATTAIFQWATVGVVDSTQCSLDGAPWANCADPSNTKALSGLATGAHAFSVLVGNVKGFQVPYLTYNWIVQAANPVSVTITSAPAASTSSTSASFSFTTAGSVTSLQCSLDGASWTTCTSPKNYNGLVLGAHVFGVLVGDGTSWSSAQSNWTVSSLPPAPVATFTALHPADGPGTTVSFGWTIANAVTTVECKLDAGAYAACASPTSVSVASTPGPHTFTVRVTGPGGQTTTASNWNVTATTGPTITITSAPTDSQSTSATINYTVTNPAPGGTAPTLTCSLDGAAASPACTQPTNAASVNGSWTKSGLAIGGHTLTMTLTDGANPDTVSVSWNVLPAAPTVTITSAPSGSTTSTSASISFTTTNSPTSVTCKLDAAAAAACTSPVPYSSLALGSHTVTITASGAGGNGVASATWTVAAGAPTATLTSTPPASTGATAASFTWSTTGTVTNTDCQIDGGAFTACTSGVTYTGLSVAAHTFVVRVTNTGLPLPNTGTATWNWTITNAPPPPTGPVNTVLPGFTPSTWKPRSGTAGTTGTATTGTWTGSPTGYAYQWYRCLTTAIASCDGATNAGAGAIAGATTASYHAVGADIDKYLRVAVTATNAGGSTTVFSNAAPKTSPS